MNMRRYHKTRYTHQQAKNGINPVARAIFWFIVLSLVLLSGSAIAFEIGQPAQAVVSVCLTKEDALGVIERVGTPEADKFFDENKNCGNIPIRFVPQEVVHAVTKDGKDYKVVKIQVGSETAYWLTSRDIKGVGRT